MNNRFWVISQRSLIKLFSYILGGLVTLLTLMSVLPQTSLAHPLANQIVSTEPSPQAQIVNEKTLANLPWGVSPPSSEVTIANFSLQIVFSVDLFTPGSSRELQHSITIPNLPVPSSGMATVYLLGAYDPDRPNEGELCINTSTHCLPLFDQYGEGTLDQQTLRIGPFTTPIEWWYSDSQATQLIFKKMNSHGYRVSGLELVFDSAGNALPISIRSSPTSGTPSTTAGSNPSTSTALAVPPASSNGGKTNLAVDFYQNPNPTPVTVDFEVMKPPAAAIAQIKLLNVYDADRQNEGKLCINTQSQCVSLFPDVDGTQDRQETTETFTTLASWWNNGKNILSFEYVNSIGFKVGGIEVSFLDESQALQNQIANGGKAALNIDFYQRPDPAAVTVTVNVGKPPSAQSTQVNLLNVYDADRTDEGKLCINTPSQCVVLFPAVDGSQDRQTTTISLTTPPEWWRDGDNTLTLQYLTSLGFRIGGIEVFFIDENTHNRDTVNINSGGEGDRGSVNVNEDGEIPTRFIAELPYPLPTLPQVLDDASLSNLINNPTGEFYVRTKAELENAISIARPGNLIRVAPGRYSGGFTAPGGTSSQPVMIVGIPDSQGKYPEFYGTRPANYVQGNNDGGTGIELTKDNIVLRNLAVRDFQVGISFGEVSKVMIDGLQGYNNRRVIDHKTGTGPVSDVVIKNAFARGYSKQFIRFGTERKTGPEVQRILIQDVEGDSDGQNNDNFCMGIMFRGPTHDVTIKRAKMVNCREFDSDDDYWNADGFVSEGATHDILYVDTYASGHTDGGYDLKGRNITMVRPIGIDNKRNFRFWGSVYLLQPIGLEPYKRGGTGDAANVWLTEENDPTLQVFGPELIGRPAFARGGGGTIYLHTWNGHAVVTGYPSENIGSRIEIGNGVITCQDRCPEHYQLSTRLDMSE